MRDSTSAQTALNRVIHLQDRTNFPLKLANNGLDYVNLVQKDPMWSSMKMPHTQEAKLALYLFC